ncbi:MAG TPA: heavy metal-binding domain-containing protein [Cyclobacteriaceae bacterium]|nr:heavy metal-binding domain-containing protein [Cyclobacteriaceae bacterium]
MKKSFLTIAILVSGLFIMSTILTGCESKKAQSTEEHEHEHEESDSTEHHHDDMDSTHMGSMPMDTTQIAFACPMHPEITGKDGDKCSKCGMKLEPVKEHKDDHEH